jgi:glycosyltransferase involved in cell wall biosynthesis
MNSSQMGSSSYLAERAGGRPRVLVLSRAYPNNVLSYLGLWVHRLVRQLTAHCDLKVIAPVPFAPPIPGASEYTRFRRIIRHADDGDVETWHPRLLVGPGRSLYASEALAYYLAARGTADRLRRSFPFDLIHAHFSYPDGVAGALLARHYGVPLIITEHAPWRPNWMDRSRIVRTQAVWAVRRSTFVIAVSTSVRTTIAEFTGSTAGIRVIPIGVDGSLFTSASNGSAARAKQLLFVGYLNFNKGVDILLRALKQLRHRHPDLRAVFVGGSTYRHTRLQAEQLQRLATELNLGAMVTFTGTQPTDIVARYMRESALLVLPSHAESFGAVLIEALACGTPVVSTHCGGPDDIVTDAVGKLVAPGDEDALAAAIEHVLAHRADYPADRLRRYALDRFAWERVAEQTASLYAEALGRCATGEGRYVPAAPRTVTIATEA